MVHCKPRSGGGNPGRHSRVRPAAARSRVPGQEFSLRNDGHPDGFGGCPHQVRPLLAQTDDLAAPPSPDAIVTTPPPAPLAEAAPPPLPGYAWDPGHWAWEGGQYVWEPGKYIVQPTSGATFTPGYWQQYSADGRGLQAAGAGEPRARASRVRGRTALP
jgi:hypothetical protein